MKLSRRNMKKENQKLDNFSIWNSSFIRLLFHFQAFVIFEARTIRIETKIGKNENKIERNKNIKLCWRHIIFQLQYQMVEPRVELFCKSFFLSKCLSENAITQLVDWRIFVQQRHENIVSFYFGFQLCNLCLGRDSEDAKLKKNMEEFCAVHFLLFDFGRDISFVRS